MFIFQGIAMRRHDDRDTDYRHNAYIRSLYPHHAEFWPGNLPEHVVFQRLARAEARRQRRRTLKRLLLAAVRALKGSRPLSSAKRPGAHAPVVRSQLCDREPACNQAANRSLSGHCHT